MPRYALEVEFAGAAFAGSQVQPGQRTVQAELHRALRVYDPAAAGLTPCGRLDAGVSARAWVAHIDLQRQPDPAELGRACNGNLPRDIAVTRVAAVADDWHARYRPHRKTYAYRLIIRPVRPVLEPRAWWLRRLDGADDLPALATALVGRHDLSAFAARRGDGSDDGDPWRTYHAATWTPSRIAHGHAWTFHITGTGFLYKQVRGLVGAMVAVARGRHHADAFHHAIDTGRSAPRLGAVAPAAGLELDRVAYDTPCPWTTVT